MFKELIKEHINLINSKKAPIHISGLVGVSTSIHILNLLDRQNIIIVEDDKTLINVYEDLKNYIDIKVYPKKDFIFIGADIQSLDIDKERISIQNKLINKEEITVITTFEALLMKLIPKNIINQSELILKLGQKISIEKIREYLIDLGFVLVDSVISESEFSIRGDIIDFFNIGYKNPVRIEVLFDEIDVIKEFDIYTQKSINNLSEITIKRTREFFFSQNKIDNNLRKSLNNDIIEAIDLFDYKSIEPYISLFYNNLESLLDYSDEAKIFFIEPKQALLKMNNLYKIFYNNIISREDILPEYLEMIFSPEELYSNIMNRFPIIFSNLDIYENIEKLEFSETDINSNYIIEYLNNKDITVILVTSRKEKNKYDNVKFIEKISDIYDKNNNVIRGNFLLQGYIRSNWYIIDKKIAIFNLANKEYKYKNKKINKKSKTDDTINLRAFSDLEIGDMVVHEDYGIGIYKGIEEIVTDGKKQDYMKIEYKNNDILYILATNFNIVQKYMGTSAKVSSLNSNEWKKTKSKVRANLIDIRDDLIKLYANRNNKKGYEFSKDNSIQIEFEDKFEFDETPDQLEAIEEIKSDMMSTKLMDRLLCGDVGFGKTEVAIRAAFKAFLDKKQVAVLVPTTILATQHYKTFSNRMKDYDVNIACLSRFNTVKETKKIIEGLFLGEIDIVIGTHKLLSDKIEYYDLGLLIIDEEQRFGVKHKEKIKELKVDIDVLSMSATPIPRTLNMSMLGIRDISVLLTPPKKRYRVQTYILEFNEFMIQEAINREILRGGQVYYIFNDVENISSKTLMLRKLLPELKIEFAHGKMSGKELENIILDFINKKIDVLVATTIIETGVDIPNVNTIIIDNADKFGLSTLYQLRGRVGRTDRRAYAFLLYQKNKVMKEISRKRLQAIREYSELGSGIRIAKRDLEIRGSGDILGANQSGFINNIGFDLYAKMLKEVVKNEKVVDFSTKITVNLDAYISNKYIKSEKDRLEIYKKINLLESKEMLYDLYDEIIDRFGSNMNQACYNLINFGLIRYLLNKIFVKELIINNKEIVFLMDTSVNIDIDKIPLLLSKTGMSINGFKFIYYINTKMTDNEILDKIYEIINEIGEINDKKNC